MPHQDRAVEADSLPHLSSNYREAIQAKEVAEKFHRFGLCLASVRNAEEI
jgi:hypothetical protein